MNKENIETIKEKLKECLELVTIRDGFIYLALRMAMRHIESRDKKHDCK